MHSTHIDACEKNWLKVIVVEDDLSTNHLLCSMIRNLGYQVTSATTSQAASSLLHTEHFDVALCDVNLGALTGFDLLNEAKQKGSPPIFIFITGQVDIDTAVTALHEGAFEYLAKPDNLSDLETELANTLGRVQKKLSFSKTAPASVPSVPPPNRGIVGRSSGMIEVYRAIAKAAMAPENALIFGETGTGKELVARAIHEKSQLANRPFVGINCGALTDSLLESELFGHVRGAFTGAVAHKRGLFEEADGGTLFLDEIGDISPSMQIKLLRAIQEGEIKPVGSAQTKHVTVRIIAATHRDLTAYVREGKFREDLYYRMKVFLVTLPPLRERREDIRLLADYFVRQYCQKRGIALRTISAEVVQLLEEYSWPGNVRELENVMARAVASANSPILFADDIPLETSPSLARPLPPSPAKPVQPAPYPTLEELEKAHIQRTLREVNFHKSKAAELLGINRVTLYRKASKYGIPLDGRTQER